MGREDFSLPTAYQRGEEIESYFPKNLHEADDVSVRRATAAGDANRLREEGLAPEVEPVSAPLDGLQLRGKVSVEEHVFLPQDLQRNTSIDIIFFPFADIFYEIHNFLSINFSKNEVVSFFRRDTIFMPALKVFF